MVTKSPARKLHAIIRTLRGRCAYPSHREHWLGWLSEYDGPGYYGRRVHKTPRSMAYIYGHIKCGPMLLWLAEAAGVSKAKLRAADHAMQAGRNPRAVIPWCDVEAALVKRGLLD